jgi:HEAT repeat protein
MRSARALVLLAAGLSACAAPAPPEERKGPALTSEMLKPLTDAYREYVASLVLLDSVAPRERADAMSKLQAGAYAYFPDDRDLIAKAAAGDDVARKELGRRGRLLDAMFAFWGPIDLPKWNDARKRICALGQDARVILVNTLLRMLLNGQLRSQWGAIRFQLVEIGIETLETAVALFRVKAEDTPDTIIYKQDDLMQVALVILAFGEPGRPYIEEFAKSPRHNVRRAVARALGEGRAAEYMDLLRRLLREDKVWMVRSAAAISMGELRAAKSAAGSALLDALFKESDRSVRCDIAAALGALAYEDAVPGLVKSLDIVGYDYVEKAMFALCQITGERLLTAEAWRKWYATEYRRWREKLR